MRIVLCLVLTFISVRADFITGQGASRALGQILTSASKLDIVRAIAVDPNTQKVFVATEPFYYQFNHIRRYSSFESLVNGADAEAVLGSPDFVTSGGASGPSRLNYASGLWVDNGGRLWVSDSVNNRVLRFDNASSKPSGANADGVLGQPDFTSTTGATAINRVRSPGRLTVDSSGRLWVADTSNYRVLRFDNAANKANGANADGVLGQPDFDTHPIIDPGTYWQSASATNMHLPSGVAVHNGSLWVGDQSWRRALRFDDAANKANGAAADAVLGKPDLITIGANWDPITSGNLIYVEDVGVDGVGDLWVMEPYRLLRFAAAATKANGASADQIISPWDAGSNPSSFNGARCLAVTGTHRVWVGDTAWVLRFDQPKSKPITGMADGILGRSSVAVPPLLPPFPSLNDPRDAAIDPLSGKVFVAERGGHRVLRYGSHAHLTTGAPPEGVLGQPNLNSTSAPASALASNMNSPSGLVLDSSGRLWVADKEFSRVLRFDNAASKANGASADGVLGQSVFTTQWLGVGLSEMWRPEGVAVDGAGRLWVADTGKHRVLRFDNAASKSNGASADGFFGWQDPDEDAQIGETLEGTVWYGLSRPTQVAVDSSGRLWIADTGSHRVIRHDNAASKSNGAFADGVLGQADFLTGAAGVTSSRFTSPRGVEVDASGRLYVSMDHRVLWFNNASSKPNGGTADGVLGQPNFTSSTANDMLTSLNTPAGVALDPAGALWVADSVNQRVLAYADTQTAIPDILSIGLNPIGQQALRFDGAPNVPYEIRSATDLTLPQASWTLEATITPFSSPVSWTDPVGATRKFYYVRRQP